MLITNHVTLITRSDWLMADIYRCRVENKTPWFDRANDILEQLCAHKYSQPFKCPVDLTIYNDYLKYCRVS